jgi:rRNA maturation endonuclease Nob1
MTTKYQVQSTYHFNLDAWQYEKRYEILHESKHCPICGQITEARSCPNCGSDTNTKPENNTTL